MTAAVTTFMGEAAILDFELSISQEFSTSEAVPLKLSDLTLGKFDFP